MIELRFSHDLYMKIYLNMVSFQFWEQKQMSKCKYDDVMQHATDVIIENWNSDNLELCPNTWNQYLHMLSGSLDIKTTWNPGIDFVRGFHQSTFISTKIRGTVWGQNCISKAKRAVLRTGPAFLRKKLLGKTQ